jgi:hypothetical protein
MKAKQILLYLGCAVIGALICLGTTKSCSHTTADRDAMQVIDSIVYVDTVKYFQPIPKDSVVLCYKVVKLPVADTTAVSDVEYVSASVDETADSASVIIPITQKVYEDSLYRAYVSGYDVALDSIFINSRTTVLTVTNKAKQKRFHIGVTAGYGLTPQGFQPYLGLGLSYSLFSF